MKKAMPIILCIILLNLALLNSLICVSGQVADSPWPTYQGDVKHTGLSPYDTTEIGGGLKWYLNLGNDIESSPVIGHNDIIYIVTKNGDLYSIFPNGTINWKFTSLGSSGSTPVIDSDGKIYFGSGYNLYCLSPNGTEKWKFIADSSLSLISPIIDNSGNIYMGSGGNIFYSVYPNGTLRWNFIVNESYIRPSPAIDDNGNIYFGTTEKLYALYPNGTHKWNYSTGNIQRAIAIDFHGNIIITALDSSHNGWLYNIHDNGSLRWKRNINERTGYSSPAIGTYGDIYICYSGKGAKEWVRAYTQNGNVNWTASLNPPSGNGGVSTSPAISSEGTIYFQTHYQTLFAVDRFGNEKWHFTPTYIDNTFTAEVSNPAIGSDGTIYYGTTDGYLYAIGPDDPPVAYFEIYPPEGNTSTGFWFDASNSTDNEDDSNMLTYEWDFGDGNTGTGIIVNHTYGHNGNYSILLTVVDSTGKSDNYTLNLSVNDSEIIKQPFISKNGLIIYGMANLIPLFLFISQQRREYEDTEQSDIDPVVSEAEEDDIVGIGTWFLSRRILIYWFAILMILDVITTYIALSNGLGYELNPFGRWLFNLDSGYLILLLLKFIVIILLAFSAFRIYKVIKQNHIYKNSMWYYSEIIIWTFMIGAMIFTVGNNLNVIL